MLAQLIAIELVQLPIHCFIEGCYLLLLFTLALNTIFKRIFKVKMHLPFGIEGEEAQFFLSLFTQGNNIVP